MKLRSITLDELITISEVKDKDCLSIKTDGIVILNNNDIDDLLSAIDQLRPERKRL